jgi:hypothetical protein
MCDVINMTNYFINKESKKIMKGRKHKFTMKGRKIQLFNEGEEF